MDLTDDTEKNGFLNSFSVRLRAISVIRVLKNSFSHLPKMAQRFIDRLCSKFNCRRGDAFVRSMDHIREVEIFWQGHGQVAVGLNADLEADDFVELVLEPSFGIGQQLFLGCARRLCWDGFVAHKRAN